MTEPPVEINEGIRQLTICNACRYCEGYCAVWEAIELKSFLNKSDAIHLANLCHDCRDCYYACPFNEPEHEYALNIPKALGNIRSVSYSTFVKPKIMRHVLESSPFVIYILVILSAFATLAFPILYYGLSGFSQIPFVHLITPEEFKVITLSVYAYTLILWIFEGYSYWKTIKEGSSLSLRGTLNGIFEVLAHKNFMGGGTGCKVPGERSTFLRAILHILVFYGFIVALISISVYPEFDPLVSFSYMSAALAISIGAVGLTLLHIVDKKQIRSPELSKIDYPFTSLLILIGITGIPIFFLHSGFWLNFDFLYHDALVLILFLLAPFSKFIHPVFRLISLIKYRSDILKVY